MSYKFISDEYTGFTSADADTLEELNVSGVFIGHEKRVGFRIGNTGTQVAEYTAFASGLNATIIDDVEFSSDNGTTFSTTATVSGIRPNEVSDRIVCKYTPAEGEYLGIGSFLIHVDEVV